MKRFILILLSVLALGSSKADEIDHNAMWDRANTAYINANYINAISCYDSILHAGYESHKLYYNMGNAYFKAGKIGHSILNYNRALLLAPHDSDTKHNLLVVGTYVKDNIQTVPEFFGLRWFRALRQLSSSNGWAVISLITLALSMGCTLLYLLVGRIAIRKTGFFGAIILLICTILFTGYSYVERQDITDSKQAVVMSSAASVKSSPDQASKDLFVLHEGTKVTVVSTLNNWAEIVIADGNKGWIPQNAIEKI